VYGCSATDERLMRLPPLPEDQWDDRTRAALAALLPPDRRNPQGAGNAMATLARHPDLTETFLPFNTRLLRSTLPPRVRELAILRVARRCACAYEWTHHVKIAAKAGLSEAEIEAAGRGEAAASLDSASLASTVLESAVLTAVDELGDTCNVSDRTWATLGEHLDERQLMDLVFTIGAYSMLAMAFNTFGVEPEQEK
jgi:4-carboxymuconolactone decarboxylase